MGGFNSQRVGYVMGLTPVQVAAWHADQLREAQKQMGEADESRAADEGVTTYERFRAEFGGVPHYRDKPEEWWREKWAEWQRNASGGE